MGLFERHKLLFSFKMTTMIMQGEDELIPAEFDFYVKGNSSLNPPKMAKPFGWISDPGWKDLELLASFDDCVKDLCKDVAANEKAWKDWY